MKADMKDDFDFSPAKSEDYPYKNGIVKEIHLMGNMMEPKYDGQKMPNELSRMDMPKKGY